MKMKKNIDQIKFFPILVDLFYACNLALFPISEVKCSGVKWEWMVLFIQVFVIDYASVGLSVDVWFSLMIVIVSKIKFHFLGSLSFGFHIECSTSILLIVRDENGQQMPKLSMYFWDDNYPNDVQQ
jgi:hypothetical protein